MAAQPDSRASARQRERNAQLLTEVLQHHEHRLRRQAHRHAELPDDVDDALQSAYLRFVERYNGLGQPLAWLYTTVKREAWGMRRRGSRRKECSFNLLADQDHGELDLAEALPADQPGPAERVEREELFAEQMRTLSTLKRDERRALGLLALGLSYMEICEATGWTYTKVNRCLSEGRAALRELQSDA
jgi:RNA polymerase sigma factor (sigma-70 family)